MRLWLTSDTHFNHANILKYCDRPFRDVDHMNWTMVANWNNLVEAEDWVIHCGDVAMGRWPDARSPLSALVGHKVLLRGNHDGSKFVALYRELGWHVMESLSIGDVLMQHHPIEEDVKFDHTLVVHGHSHGGLVKERHIDVGVDDSRWTKYEPIDARYVIGVEATTAILITLNTMFS